METAATWTKGVCANDSVVAQLLMQKLRHLTLAAIRPIYKTALDAEKTLGQLHLFMADYKEGLPKAL
jgi:hypothetical protein